ncbi:hypothetical protein CSC81_18610, partial [Tenacibaculum discolor]
WLASHGAHVARGGRHPVRVHPLHERGPALRPHLADAPWPRAGCGLTHRIVRTPGLRNAGAGLHRLSGGRQRGRAHGPGSCAGGAQRRCPAAHRGGAHPHR